MSAAQAYHHVYRQPTVKGAPVWVLLHGTGGSEHDLVPVLQRVSPGSGHLALRGSVMEGDMRRFFKRVREGVFDLQSLKEETERLHSFLEKAVATYHLQQTPLAGLGYSNGANLLASYLLAGGGHPSGAVLWRPMTPFQPPQTVVGQTPVLMLSGLHDGIATRADAERLARLLAAGGAAVDHQFLPIGHQLVPDDFTRSARWVKAQGWQIPSKA